MANKKGPIKWPGPGIFGQAKFCYTTATDMATDGSDKPRAIIGVTLILSGGVAGEVLLYDVEAPDGGDLVFRVGGKAATGELQPVSIPFAAPLYVAHGILVVLSGGVSGAAVWYYDEEG